MEVEERRGDLEGRIERSRCYRILLFLLDLILICLLVPRGTRMSVRLVLLIALRYLLTALGAAANVGLYQAFLYNSGQSPETQLASSINAIFGVEPVACQRGKRDTWEILMKRLEDMEEPRLPGLTRPKLPKSLRRATKQLGVSTTVTTFSTQSTTVVSTPSASTTAGWTTTNTTSPASTTDAAALSSTKTTSVPATTTTLRTFARNISTTPLTQSTSPFSVQMEIDNSTLGMNLKPVPWENEEVCFTYLHLLLALIFCVSTASMNLIMVICLIQKMRQLRYKEDQLRSSFDALQRIYAAGNLFSEVGLQ